MSAKVKTKPLAPRNERAPTFVAPRVPRGASRSHKVRDGDTWESVAFRFFVNTEELIRYNFETTVAEEVNWYLREYVGCNVKSETGRNWKFSSSADPGIIYIPQKTIHAPDVKSPLQDNRSDVDVGEYDDSDFLDTLGKVLDVTGAIDTGLTITQWSLPALLEGGLIAAGAASAFLAEMLAIGGGHLSAFQEINRQRFFGGLSIALVMTVNARSADEIKSKYYYRDPQRFYNPVYPEKAKTFLALNNAGVLVGIGKGNNFSDLERSNFRSFLRSKLTSEQRQRFSGMGSVAVWQPQTRTEYFELLAAKNREIILKNNLKIRIR